MEDSSIFSHSSQDVSSTVSLYNMPVGEEISMKAVLDYDPSEDHLGSGISRPMSRSSATSSLSMVATKDGVEGRKVHRYGIPQYSLNLLNSMSTSGPKPKVHSKQQMNTTNHLVQPKPRSLHSEELGVMQSPDLALNAPMTLREKMRLLNYKSENLQYSSSAESLPDRNEDNEPDSLRNTSEFQRGPRSILETMSNDAGSNRSTTGDDFSYLGDVKSLPPVSVPVEVNQGVPSIWSK
ncbi:LADA_0F10704g1_1 [Lachancea dasiensis]|uniref:LADA_0F10704g1_1 n=1 Tax=Lachancea dasiensis TaxID=1072105 RepID=A0A1G4JLU2_9SACH|nr:LADA_0F10704g1_1 [Lachancea dasiensis]